MIGVLPASGVGRTGEGEVWHCKREVFTALRVSVDVVKSLWVKTLGKDNKADIVESVYY